MTAIPANAVTPEDIAKWNDLKLELARVKASEMLLRLKLYGGLFHDPDEGTNTLEMLEGWKLKAVRVIDRKVDIAMANNLAVEGGPFHLAGIRAADLIEWKPELKIKEYRTLTAEQKLVFDQCLTIKDGSPQLSLVAPKGKE